MLLDRLAHRRPGSLQLVLALALPGLTLLAWTRRFIQDDAFISFRYADNLAHGKGLVWNEGERVAGYSNPLYTLIMSGAIHLGLDPVTFSHALGLAAFAATLVLTYTLALRLLHSAAAALAAMVLLGTNYSFSSYATGGMETGLQAGLFVATIHLLVRSMDGGSWPAGTLIALSALLGLALVTRLDSALLAIVILPVALACSVRATPQPARRLARVLCLTVPLAVLAGAWAAWALQYYGDVLPNTYYVKAASPTSIGRGAAYVYLFLRSYWLLPLAALLLYFARDLAAAANRALLLPAAMVVLWLSYTIRVGGDFMEFRFLVPILPLCFVLFAWVIFTEVRWAPLRVALVAVALVGSIQHAYTFRARPMDVESITELADHLSDAGDGWARIGKVLGDAFEHDPAVTIAVTAAGAIPFYSRLGAVDMLGLNDRWVAREGLALDARPGHQRMATFAYLLDRRVNLVLAHPITVDIHAPGAAFAASRAALLRFVPMLSDHDRLPEAARVVEIPISATRKLLALYLTRNPRVDAALERHHWRAHALDLREPDRTRPPGPAPALPPGARVDMTTGEGDGYLWYGWSGREFNLRWSTGDTAAIVFGLGRAGASILHVEIGRFLYPGRQGEQRVSVELNGTPVATLTLSGTDPREYAIALPGNLLREENTLTLAVADARTREPLGRRGDPPRLGISVRWLELRPSGGA